MITFEWLGFDIWQGFSINDKLEFTSFGIRFEPFAITAGLQLFVDLSADINNDGSPVLFEVYGGASETGVQLGGSSVGMFIIMISDMQIDFCL